MVSRTPSNGHPAGSVRPSIGTRDVIRILFRHRRKMLIVFSATIGLVVLGIIVFPRSYTSDARMFVRLGRESVGLDPTASLNETISVNDSRESEINSELEILRSRVLLDDVVSRVGADYVLNTSSNGEAGIMDTLLAPVDVAKTWLSGVVSPEERAATKLESDISVYAGRKSNVITVKCRAKNPEQAQKLLQVYLDAYQDRHAKANRTHGSFEFFVDQSQLLREQLERATAELRDAKNDMTLVSVEGQRQNVQTQAASIEEAMLENERALAHSEAKVAALEKALVDLPSELMAEQSQVPSAAADAMRNELYKLQIQEKEVSSRFTSLHPQVIALRRQVAETQKILEEQGEHRSQTTRKLSPVHQTVQTELTAARAMAAAERAEMESLKAQYDGVRSKIQTLNNNEFRLTDLSRKAELLEISYKTYTTNREQARINQELAIGQISNVNVVQQASFVAKPSSPRVMLTLIAGLFLATLSSVAVAFIAEYVDPSLKTSEEIEHELGIPVLFSVPRVSRYELLHN